MYLPLFFFGLCITIVSSEVQIEIGNHCGPVDGKIKECQQISCGNVTNKGLSDELANLITQGFNRIRQDVAQGKVNGLPKAANMNVLSYDEILAKTIAGDGKCPEIPFKSSGETPNYSLFSSNESFCPGLFSYLIMSTAFKEGEPGACFITPDVFASTLPYFGEDEGILLDSYQNFNDKLTIPEMNFIHIMWAQSNRVGCAISCTSNPGLSISTLKLRCLFSPCGNIPNEPIFEEGEPCSKCESTCSKDYPSLCDHNNLF